MSYTARHFGDDLWKASPAHQPMDSSTYALGLEYYETLPITGASGFRDYGDDRPANVLRGETHHD